MKERNDQRALLAITLSLAVFTAWSYFFGPKPDATEVPQDTSAETIAAPAAPAVPTSAASPPTDEGPCVPEPRPLRTAVADLSLDNCGRGLGEVRVVDTAAPLTVTPWWTWIWATVTFKAPGSWVPYVAPEGSETLVGAGGSFATAGRGELLPGGTWVISEAAGESVIQRVTSDGLTVATTLRGTDAPDVFDLTVRWESTVPLNGPLWVGLDDTFIDISGSYDGSPRLEAVVDGDLESLAAPSEQAAVSALPGPVSWFGVTDRYFLAALLPEDPAWGELAWAPTKDGRVGAFLIAKDRSLTPGQPVEATFKVYVGPKDVERLQAVGNRLEDAASLGWFAFFGKIFLFILHVFQKGLVNWGLAIIALTFLVRLSLYPIMRSSFISAKKMQLVAPKIKELQETMGDNKEAIGQATFALYREHGVNPLGGCLPAVIQIPIFLGLFNGLRSTPDLYQASFLYIHDLSMPDPYGLFPGLMTLGMVLQQRLMPMAGMDPTQQQMMRLMPFMFAIFMFGMPAGLSLYYVVNTALAIFQQWYNMRSWEKSQLASA